MILKHKLSIQKDFDFVFRYVILYDSKTIFLAEHAEEVQFGFEDVKRM